MGRWVCVGFGLCFGVRDAINRGPCVSGSGPRFPSSPPDHLEDQGEEHDRARDLISARATSIVPVEKWRVGGIWWGHGLGVGGWHSHGGGLAEQTAPIDAVYDTPHLTCSSVQHFACGSRQLRKQSHPQRLDRLAHPIHSDETALNSVFLWLSV